MNDVIILSDPRTGSNYLTEFFFKYNEFRILSEFYLEVNVYDKDLIGHLTFLTSDELQKFYNYYKINNDIISLLKRIREDSITADNLLNKVIPNYKILKIHRRSIQKFNLEFMLEKYENFIWLTRNDILAQFVSREIAIKTGKWHRSNTSSEKIMIDVSKFLEYKENYTKNLSYKNLLTSKNVLEINYEHDLCNPDENHVFQKISKWLNKINISFTTNNYKLNFFNKQNNNCLSNTILNWHDVVKYI